MAMRGGPSRRLTGNPLGGMLRDLDRQTRRTTRRSRPTSAEEPREERPAPPEPVPPPVPVLRPGPVAAAVVSTVPGGRAVWLPDPAHGELVVSAVVAGPGGPYTVNVLEAGPGRVVLQVWELVRHGRGMRWAEAGAGVRVHVTGSPAGG
ncbi:hypothetical protein [Streptomyces sp. NPDC006355]|uniref:hypothetical protein n=1 Tax=Streptomyces sp. NPDC006355 TaxID=3156758 RepID=UPI0033AFBE49